MTFPLEISGYSQGLYSSWYWLKNAKILLDCGDGCAAKLGPSCGAIKAILLSHGHIDHISGLPAILWARNAAMGPNQKTLPIYFPTGDPYVAKMRAFLEDVGGEKFKVSWREIVPGEVFSVGSRDFETFPTQHTESHATVGYKMIEWKRVLKPQFADLEREKIIEHRMNGTWEEISEKVGECVAAFCGDSVPVEAKYLRDAQIVFHEATALSDKDLGEKNHSTLAQALEVAREANPQHLVLTHYSSRYGRTQFAEAARDAAREMNLDFRVWCFLKDDLRLVF